MRMYMYGLDSLLYIKIDGLLPCYKCTYGGCYVQYIHYVYEVQVEESSLDGLLIKELGWRSASLSLTCGVLRPFQSSSLASVVDAR